MEFESGLDPREFVVREASDVSMKAFFRGSTPSTSH